MPHIDRLALAFQTGALGLPAAGDVLVLRAAPSPFLDLVPPDRLRCVQSFRPVHDALAERGHAVSARAEGPAAMVVVNLTRSRAENLGNIARGLGMLPPGGTLVIAGAKSDGVESLARQVARALPLDGAFVKAHGRVAWLTRPDRAAGGGGGLGGDAAPGRNAEGFVTAPGLFSPDKPTPAAAGSRRASPGGSPAASPTSARAGGGWRRRCSRRSRRSPRSTSTRRRRRRSTPRAPTSPIRGRGSTGPTPPGSAPGVPPYDAVITNPPFHQGRAAEPDLGAAFIAAAARILKPAGRLVMVANRQLPYEATLAAAFRHWEKLGGRRLQGARGGAAAARPEHAGPRALPSRQRLRA